MSSLQPYCLLVFLLMEPPSASWPQWGGPHRNFKVESNGLADVWPESGPRRLWTRPLGDGYSGIAVVGDKLYTMCRKDDHESLVALDSATGQTIWEHRYAAPFLPNTDLEPGPGPHTTPLVVDGRVFAVGVTGILYCLESGSGRVVWSHDLLHEFDGTILFRGYSSSPIAYQDLIILPVGGASHAVVAFRMNDGSVQWQSQDFQTSHVSPLLITFQGQDQLVVLASKVIAGLAPSDGQLIWQHSQPMDGGHIASMPVWGDDGRLFFSSAYGGGSWCLALTREGDKTVAHEVWHNNRLRVHHSNVIRVGDHIYGPSGDFGPMVYSALDVTTGQIAWQDRRLLRTACVYADGKFIMLEEDGHLVLASMSPHGLTIRSRAELFQSRAWTVPSLVGRNLYVRNREAIMALKLP